MAEKVKNQEEELVEEEIVEEEIIEEEEEESGEDQTFFEKYRRIIFLGAGIFLLVGAYWIFRGSGKTQKNEEGQISLIGPTYLYEANLSGQAPDSLMTQAINGPVSFSAIAQDAKGTKAGNLAKLYLGTVFLKLGQIDQAITNLEDFDKGDDVLSSAVYSALGSAYEEKKNWDKSAENYELAASTPEETESLTPFYLKNAGRVYESAGKKEQALKVYQKIKAKYPLSPVATDIDKYIGRCQGGAGGEE